MHIRKTNSTGCDLEKKLALPKRRPGNLLHAEFVISRNQRLHHPWLVTGHVPLITSSNAFTKQVPSSRERERAFLHLCWSYLMRLDHVASFIVNANHSITRRKALCCACGLKAHCILELERAVCIHLLTEQI